mgnify:CR=1 FL=1
MLFSQLTKTLTIILGAVVITSCATIASGRTQVVTVGSNVDGADIFLDGVSVGTTPFTGELRKGGNNLRIEAQGYESQTVSLSRSLEPVFWGNIIIGGTLGSITDFAAGSAYQYQPATYQVELRSSDQDLADFNEQLVLRKFSMLYADEISRDLGQGGGEHLEALVGLLSENNDRDITISDIQLALQRSQGDLFEFGENVLVLR